MARKAPPKAAKKAARKAAPKTAKAAAPRRPAQIPKAQWDKLGASTRKRYAGYFKKHPEATVQQARGHKEPREAARRREKAEDFIESINASTEAVTRSAGAKLDSEMAMATWPDPHRSITREPWARKPRGISAAKAAPGSAAARISAMNASP